MRNTTDEKQWGGNHYKTGGLEHWTICAGSGIGYLESCASKYLIRWRKKGGILDLYKSQHFLEKLIEMIESGAIPKNRAKINRAMLKSFYADANIPYPESLIIDTIFTWKHAAHLKLALKLLNEFIDEQEAGPTSAYVNQD